MIIFSIFYEIICSECLKETFFWEVSLKYPNSNVIVHKYALLSHSYVSQLRQVGTSKYLSSNY